MSVILYKCPNCGGELVFDPSLQKYTCPYCQSIFTQQEIDSYAVAGAQGREEEDAQSGQPQDESASQEHAKEEQSFEGAVYYSCPSCGAQIITDATTAATFCYYCHNPVVLEGRLSGAFLPDQVLPFEIDREKAVAMFREKIGKKWFVPRAFFNEEQIEKLTGIYYPYWVYSCRMDGQMEGTGTKVRVYMAGDREITETSIYGVARAGKITFDHLTRNALKKTDRLLVENVQPFSLEGMQPFSMGYLSGFQAEKRDMETDAFAGEVHKAVEGYASNVLRDSISGYSTFTTSYKNFVTEEEHWKYVLLPVWVLTYAGAGGKIYYFAMNGQNGNVSGSFPINWGKLSAVSAMIFAVITVLGLLGGYLL